MEVDRPVHVKDTEVTMEAILDPDKPIAQHYKWNFLSSVFWGKSHCQGKSKTEVCKFKERGRSVQGHRERSQGQKGPWGGKGHGVEIVSPRL